MQGNMGSIPGQGTKTPPAMEQLSLHTPTAEPSHSRALKTSRAPAHDQDPPWCNTDQHVLQPRPDAAKQTF